MTGFEAQFRGWCHECEEPILIGQRIERTSETRPDGSSVYVHVFPCPAGPPASGTETVCPICFLTSCDHGREE